MLRGCISAICTYYGFLCKSVASVGDFNYIVALTGRSGVVFRVTQGAASPLRSEALPWAIDNCAYSAIRWIGVISGQKNLWVVGFVGEEVSCNAYNL